jgi:Spy/CpxP family protein refolding chaperone
MSKRNLIVGSILTAGLLGLAAAGADTGAHCYWGHARHESARFAGPGTGGRGLWMQGLQRLDLTEQQGDQIFQIVYAQEPAMRDLFKTLRKSREALRSAALEANYDQARVRSLADAQAKTQSDLAVMRAEMVHRIYSLLTPEQKQKLAERTHRDKSTGD